MTRTSSFSAILSSQEMRQAEVAAMAGVTGARLMDRAGRAMADAIRAFACPMPTLILCGPGNNGGDGYVIAAELVRHGWPVTVASLGVPRTSEARGAAGRYHGPFTPFENAQPQPLLVDALFGTGLVRPLEARVAQRLAMLAGNARVAVAVDLPSGVDSDSGALLGAQAPFAMTIAAGALKRAHVLYPSAGICGRLVVADIGIAMPENHDCHLIRQPVLNPPGPSDHKYTRGFVTVVGGEMRGAAVLSARAAQAAGAGYVVLADVENGAPFEPASIIQRCGSANDVESLLEDQRISALVVGPGLGRGRDAALRLDAALARPHRLVLDADALTLLSAAAVPLSRRLEGQAAVLTPHQGEFNRLFGELPGSRMDQARQAAETAGAVVLLKGPDAIIAAPDGRTAIDGRPCFWLATAGTGDVLSGVIGAMLARGLPPFEAACAGLWLHGEAAQVAGPALAADHLVPALRHALAEVSCPNQS